MTWPRNGPRRWSGCETNVIGSLHGRCRVHRAEILRLRGSCDEAEHQTIEACQELRPYLRRELGWPLNELGRIRLHKGDIAGAEEALLAAHRAGWDPQPGLALVRLAQGDPAAAAAAIRDALERPLGVPSKERPPNTHLQRAPLLEAQVEIESRPATSAGPDRPPTNWSSSPPDSRAKRCSPARPSLEEGCGSPTAMPLARNSPCRKRCDAGTRSAPPMRRRSPAWPRRGAPRQRQPHRAALERQAARIILEGIQAAPSVAPPERVEHHDAPDEQPLGSFNVFRREGDYWSVSFEGRTVHMRDLKGMRYLARLLADPGREYHVLDLVAAETGSGAQGAEQPRGRPGALGTRRRGREPRRPSQGRLPPTPGRDRRRHRASPRHRRRRAGRAG